MSEIKRLSSIETLDSRGRPTVQARCELASGATGTAYVPSGASTGQAEALELRDNDPRRYRGLGCRKAVEHINRELHESLIGRLFTSQAALNQALPALGGTENKSRLGANALLAVSLAFARAVAAKHELPLYHYFAAIVGELVRTLPRPTVNLFSGGKHAGGQVAIQDVLLVPASARTMDEALAMVFEVYQSAAEFSQHKYGSRALKADEGSLAPPFASAQAMLEDTVAAIEATGFKPGEEVALAVDVAATHFFQEGYYYLDNPATPLEATAVIEKLVAWLQNYPIVSLEDGLAEDDWQHWPQLRAKVAGRALVLGDDLPCTNPGRINRAVETGAADALLLKVNQIGTLSEAAQPANSPARPAGELQLAPAVVRPKITGWPTWR